MDSPPSTASITQAKDQTGLPVEKQRLNEYDLRHSRATHWVENSQNLAGVAFLLGHREVSTLNKYVRPSQRAAEQVLAAVAAAGGPDVSSGAPEAQARQLVAGSSDYHLTTTDDREPLAARAVIHRSTESGTKLRSYELVRGGGLEPPSLSAVDPKSTASTNSAILARKHDTRCTRAPQPDAGDARGRLVRR